MKRQKSPRELRDEIMRSPVLRAKSQEEISRSLSLHQATLSRILRGKFKRRSDAVDRVCKYAQISCITEQPPAELDDSIDRLTRAVEGNSASKRHAIKLIRLAVELLEHESLARS
jgi:transcriptional regulator with XRE-family HTH domain